MTSNDGDLGFPMKPSSKQHTVARGAEANEDMLIAVRSKAGIIRTQEPKPRTRQCDAWWSWPPSTLRGRRAVRSRRRHRGAPPACAPRLPAPPAAAPREQERRAGQVQRCLRADEVGERQREEHGPISCAMPEAGVRALQLALLGRRDPLRHQRLDAGPARPHSAIIGTPSQNSAPVGASP